MSQFAAVKQSYIRKQKNKDEKFMKKFLTADEVLFKMINILIRNLGELKEFQDVPGQAFQYGEKTAYIECLEILQQWEKASELGVGFDVEFYFNFK